MVARYATSVLRRSRMTFGTSSRLVVKTQSGVTPKEWKYIYSKSFSFVFSCLQGLPRFCPSMFSLCEWIVLTQDLVSGYWDGMLGDGTKEAHTTQSFGSY